MKKETDTEGKGAGRQMEKGIDKEKRKMENKGK